MIHDECTSTIQKDVRNIAEYDLKENIEDLSKVDESSPLSESYDDYTSEDEYDAFTDYMDEYIQKELDAQIQSQLDHQMDVHHQQAEFQLHHHLNAAMAKDAELLSAQVFESDTNRSGGRLLASTFDDEDEDAEIRDIFLSMNLAHHSSDGKALKEKTTAEDINKAIRCIVDKIKIDE
eukprot:scaffold1724_cov226-Chaetoceros_neogracile.AAC.13